MRLVLLLLAVTPSLARAEPRVAVIEKGKLDEQGGIARLLAAHDQLAQEKPTFRLAEKIPGRSDWVLDSCKPPIAKNWEKPCENFRRADAASREAEAWKLHEAEVLGPIELHVDMAIAAYAKSRGIEPRTTPASSTWLRASTSPRRSSRTTTRSTRS